MARSHKKMLKKSKINNHRKMPEIQKPMAIKMTEKLKDRNSKKVKKNQRSIVKVNAKKSNVCYLKMSKKSNVRGHEEMAKIKGLRSPKYAKRVRGPQSQK